MEPRKSHQRYLDQNQRRLKTIEEHKSEEDQTLQRIVTTSPIKFATGKFHTQPVENINQLNSLNQVKELFDRTTPIKERLSIQTSKHSNHRRNKTEISSTNKNKLKDPVYNSLFVPFLQTKSFDFGNSLKDIQKSKTPKRKALSNPKSQSYSLTDNQPSENEKRYSHREKKVYLPGISQRKSIRSSIQINEAKLQSAKSQKVSNTLHMEPKTSQKPFITMSSIGQTGMQPSQKNSTFRLPIEAKNLRDFKAKDRENKLTGKRKQKKQKQWKEINYLQLKTCYYHIGQKIASTSTMSVVDSNVKIQSNKNENSQLKGLKKDLILHERMPKVQKLPTIIEEVSLIIKNYHSIRKNKVSIDKLIKSKEFAVKFVQKQFLYFGQLKNQRFHGYGVLIKPDYLFEGQWREGQKVTGAQCKKGVYYEGDFLDNKKIGFGTSYWNGGHDEYSGQWKDGLKNGNGVWKNLDGDQYIGHWVNGKVQGFGVHTTGDGQKYEGFFTNFLKQGKGKQTFANGDEYEGNFQQGKPSGYGVYKFYRAQAVYEGNFEKGLRHGQGKFVVENNFEYNGEFTMDCITGYGKVTYINNDCYIGNFKDGLRHGKGSLHKFKERKILNGYWKNGQFSQKE